MRLQSRYEYDPERDLLGKGGFARVYRARDELLHREVALKVFNASGKHGYTVLDEIRKVIQLEHPNLLRYYDVLLLEQANALGEKEQLQIGVMEYANGGDLKGYARANPGSPMLIKLLKQVLLGLEYLHGKGIIHRDLKAANILLVLDDKGEPTAKISDFGISKDMGAGQQSSSMMVGTIEYMAPEQFSPAKYGIDGKVGTNVDLWAFGVMVHELLLDSTPFGGRDGDTTVEQIMASILSTEQPKDIERLPEPYRSVVKRCLVANAKERIRKAAELIEYLEGMPSPKPQASTAEAETKVYPRPPTSARTGNANQHAETRAYGASAEVVSSQKQPSASGWKEMVALVAILGILAAFLYRVVLAREPWQPCDRCPQMLPIAGGEFVLGSPPSEEGRQIDEGPQRTISIRFPWWQGPGDLWASRTEVTVDHFRYFVEQTSYRTDAERNFKTQGCFSADAGIGRKWDWVKSASWRSPGWNQDSSEPVVCVSWRDAQEYVRWLSAHTGRRFRLLSEAEWEYVARAGAAGQNASSGTQRSICEVANIADRTEDPQKSAWKESADCRDGHWYPSPAGTFAPNAFGLHDTLGNVWEWVEDCYFEDGYSNLERDGRPIQFEGACSERAMRGGSWNSGPRTARLANRDKGTPEWRSILLGFRVAVQDP